jgi:hypothetical protein
MPALSTLSIRPREIWAVASARVSSSKRSWFISHTSRTPYHREGYMSEALVSRGRCRYY